MIFNLMDGWIDSFDPGPQIAWRTVFIIEYLGPLLIHPLIYFVLRPYIYHHHHDGDDEDDAPTKEANSPPSTRQMLCLVLITLHFLKRELETVLVHRFSNATMPASNIIKNSGHYWILAGLNMAYWIYSPSASIARVSSPTDDAFIIYPALALYLFGELANLSTHLTLRDLRRPGSTERGIPRGFGFDLVTCPNYFFELLAWIAIGFMTANLSTLLFILVAGAQMTLWARKKETRYRREFGAGYPKKRYTILPGII